MASSKTKTVQKPEAEFKSAPPDKPDQHFEKVLVKKNCEINGNYTIFQIQCSKNESELNPDISLNTEQNQSIQISNTDQRHVFFELCPEKCNITFKITANCSINDSHCSLLRQEIWRHIIVAHPNPEYCPCFKCNFKFFNDIGKHERNHHASSMIRSCGICGKSCKTNEGVTKHIFKNHSTLLGLQAGIGRSETPDNLTDESISIKSRLRQKFSELKLDMKGKLQLIRDQYIAVFSEEIGMPLLTLELLTPEQLENNLEERFQNRSLSSTLYKLDIEAGISQLTNQAIKYVYCVQGHLAAAANHRNELNPYLETFLMSNIVPMNPSFNMGVWLSLENYVRKLAKLWDQTTVITGIIVDKNATLEAAGPNCIHIPTKCWKIVVYKRFGGIKNVQSFLIPNNNESCGIFNFISTIEEIEEAAGLKFATAFKDKLVCPINKITDEGDKNTLAEKSEQQEKSKSPVLKSNAANKSQPRQLKPEESSKVCSTERAIDRNVVNPDKITHICPHCNKAFSEKEYLKKHLLLHEPKSFKCVKCSKGFVGPDQLKIHLRTAHFVPSGTLKSLVSRRVPRPKRRPLTVEENPEPGKFVCQKCEKVFATLVNFNRHKKFHGSKSFKCDKCNQAYVELKYLNRHKRLSHSVQVAQTCPKCNKVSSNNDNLRKHMKRHSQGDFSCEMCSKAFLQLHELTRHKRETHFEQTEDSLTFICIICEKEFSTEKKFKRHSRLHKPKVFICELCSAGFGELHLLERHRRTHSKESESINKF